VNTVCELVGIAKQYRGHQVLSEFSLTVAEGEMIAITGPSGSGKSTLLNIIGLLDSPQHGSVKLFGQPAPDPGSAAATKLLRHRIGYLFQSFALIDNETVDYNLRVAQTYAHGTPQTKARARSETLEAVGLSGVRRVYELSGGEQQRVAVARLMLKPCDLVLADEPTGSLDPANRDAILTMLTSLNERSHKTVIVVTHDPKVTAACTRSLRLDAQDTSVTTSPTG
jgi:putative ABC transport system ATP-binding protein